MSLQAHATARRCRGSTTYRRCCEPGAGLMEKLGGDPPAARVCLSGNVN
jgi:hypothetical protein